SADSANEFQGHDTSEGGGTPRAVRRTTGSLVLRHRHRARRRLLPIRTPRACAVPAGRVAGMKLSEVVLADFAQLFPDRTVTLTVSGNPNQFDLSLRGVSYSKASWGPGPFPPIDDMTNDPNFEFLGVFGAPELTAPPLVTVRLERRIRGTHDEAGWEVIS